MDVWHPNLESLSGMLHLLRVAERETARSRFKRALVAYEDPQARPDRPKNRRFTSQATSHAQSTWWCRSIGVRAAY